MQSRLTTEHARALDAWTFVQWDDIFKQLTGSTREHTERFGYAIACQPTDEELGLDLAETSPQSAQMSSGMLVHENGEAQQSIGDIISK